MAKAPAEPPIVVVVPARSLSTPVVRVAAGEVWDFSAAGDWRDGFLRTGADGYDGVFSALFGVWPRAPDQPIFKLIGEVAPDSGATPVRFAIGSASQAIMPVAGLLQVFANDVKGFYWNNAGAVTLTAARARPAPLSPVAAPPATLCPTWWTYFLDTLERTRGLLAILLLALVASAALALTSQGRDLVAAIADDAGPKALILGPAILAGSVALLALQAWFWSRRIIEANYGLHRSTWGPARPYLVWAPRVLGLLPPVVMALTLGWLQSSGLRERCDGVQDCPTDAGGWAALVMIVIFALGFFAFVHRREAVMTRLTPAALTRLGWLWPVFVLVAGGLAFLAVVINPAWASEAFGPAPVVFFAIACSIPGFVIAAQIGQHLRIPAVPLLMLLAALSSCANDGQHMVGRRAFQAPPPALQADPRLTTEQVFLDWIAHVPPAADGSLPVVVVASEGGASRAGYWTGVALDQLETQTHGAFSRHLFAISSISGASVGAVGWAAALHRPNASALLQTFTGEDALSPSLGGMLFPDALQRFLPFPVLPDRAEGLEGAWEKAWSDGCGGCGAPDLMRGPYRAIWTPDPNRDPMGWRPLVFVGGAMEEDGRRITTAPVKLPAAMDTYDFYAQTPLDIRASTAIHNGARFQWVSPAGRVAFPTVYVDKATGHAAAEPGPGRTAVAGSAHIIDGGYFDASGVESARELVVGLKAALTSRALSVCAPGAVAKGCVRFYLVVLRYCDDGAFCPVAGSPAAATLSTPTQTTQSSAAAKAGATEVAPPLKASVFAADAFAPLKGMMNSRQGHQSHLATYAALDPDLQRYTVLLRGSPCEGLPLNWVLSRTARDYIRSEAVAAPSSGGHGTAAQLQTVAGLLGPAAAPAPAASRTFACEAFGRPR